MDYCDVFISFLDSHTAGTHSLQRIHWWASDAMLHFYKSDEETTSSTSQSTFSANLSFLGEVYSFNPHWQITFTVSSTVVKSVEIHFRSEVRGLAKTITVHLRFTNQQELQNLISSQHFNVSTLQHHGLMENTHTPEISIFHLINLRVTQNHKQMFS